MKKVATIADRDFEFEFNAAQGMSSPVTSYIR